MWTAEVLVLNSGLETFTTLANFSFLRILRVFRALVSRVSLAFLAENPWASAGLCLALALRISAIGAGGAKREEPRSRSFLWVLSCKSAYDVLGLLLLRPRSLKSLRTMIFALINSFTSLLWALVACLQTTVRQCVRRRNHIVLADRDLPDHLHF